MKSNTTQNQDAPAEQDDWLDHVLGICMCFGEAEEQCWFHLTYERLKKESFDSDVAENLLDKERKAAILAHVDQHIAERVREAFKQGQRVGQYQAADKLYGHVTQLYLFKDSTQPKIMEHLPKVADNLRIDSEKYINHNRKAYGQYVAALSKEQPQ